jgi:hypothetical protein
VITFYVLSLALRLAVVVLAVGCVNLTPPPDPRLADGAVDRALEVGARPDQEIPIEGPRDVVDSDAGIDMAGETVDGPGLTSDGPPDADPGPDGPPPDGALLVTGSSCSLASQCASGFCAQGRCCNEVCTAVCFACDLGEAAGTCTAIASGDSSRSRCQTQAASTCGLDGTCDGSGGCRRHPSGTTCAAATCSGSAQTATRTCNGQGVCQTGTTSSCGAYQCDGAAASCRTTCSLPEHCQAGFVCSGTSCVPGPPITNLTVHDTDASRAGLWSLRTNFQVGSSAVHPWPDWPNTYVVSVDAAASGLLGKQWVRVSAESKQYAGPGPQATLTLSRATALHMVVDERWGTSPTFTSGWTYTGNKMTVYESSTRPSLPFRIFARTVSAGSVGLPAIGDNNAYNFFIVAD